MKFIFVMLLFFGLLFSCSCAPPKDPVFELNSSSAVFVGKVVEVRDLDDIENGVTPVPLIFNNENRVTFEVNRSWKGVNGSTVEVETSKGDASCGFSFQKGEEYLVYSDGKEDDFYVSQCTRTKKLSEAKEDLDALGQATKISAPIPFRCGTTGSFSDFWDFLISSFNLYFWRAFGG